MISSGMSTGPGVATVGIRDSTRGEARREARRLRKPIGGGPARRRSYMRQRRSRYMIESGSAVALAALFLATRTSAI